MNESLLSGIAIAEVFLLELALAVLVGHAVWKNAGRRRHHRRRAAAVLCLCRALDDTREEPWDVAALDRLSTSAQISVFGDAAQSLTGCRRQQLADLAAQVGLIDTAERWCRSRRWWRRLRGLRVLTLLGTGAETVPALFDDPRPEVRAQAAQWVTDHPEPRHIAHLLGMLAAEGSLCRFTVKDALLRIGHPATEPVLRHIEAAAGHPTPEALEVAIGIADARFLGPALALCGSADPATRALAARLAAAVGGARVTDELTTLLADADPDVRAAAADGLGRLGHWPAAGPLAACLEDASWEVRRAGALALRSLGAPGLIVLRRAVFGEDAFARDMARHVLELHASLETPREPDRVLRAVVAR